MRRELKNKEKAGEKVVYGDSIMVEKDVDVTEALWNEDIKTQESDRNLHD